MSIKKRFFAKHAKSSAALVSLGIHAVLVLVALSFVAVTVIQKEDKAFEAKPVSRPKMNLRKLQVPVNIKKKKVQKPKLRKRIVVQPKMNQTMPDIKMPEITGVKGGLGNAAGDGLGGAGALGFSMPEIEIFGVKGKGEKIVLILGAGADMMADQMGGIEAYSIIKDEMVRIVEELPSTALFNVMIYDWKTVAMAFPDMVAATDGNAHKMKEWIDPLNAVKKGMGDSDYGIHTLKPGGTESSEMMVYGKFANPDKVGAKKDSKIDGRDWYRAAMLAHRMGADTIFVLTDTWGLQRVATSQAKSRDEWNLTTAGKKWNAAYKQSLKTLDEENKARTAAGKPPKIISRNEWSMRKDYYPDLQTPPSPEWYNFSPRDFAEAFVLNRAANEKGGVQTTSGLSKRKKSKKIDFSYNVIQFVPQGGSSASSAENFTKLTSLCGGEYKTVSGLAEVQSYVKSAPIE